MKFEYIFKYALINLIILITYSNLSAQKIALIDTKLKIPIVYTDSVSVSQVSKGFIAIPIVDLDTLYSNLVYISSILSSRQRSKMQSFQLLTKSTEINVSRVPMAYGDRYTITLISQNDIISSKMTISSGKHTNRVIVSRIKKILDYLRSNNSLFAPPTEIHPRIYNVVVISDK